MSQIFLHIQVMVIMKFSTISTILQFGCIVDLQIVFCNVLRADVWVVIVDLLFIVVSVRQQIMLLDFFLLISMTTL